MRILDRNDKRRNMSLIKNIPTLIKQDYNHPAVMELDGKRWTSTCIGCVDPKCMFYSDEEIMCEDIPDFPAEKNNSVCPIAVISWNDEAVMPVIDTEHCIKCGLCAARCPVGAIYYDEETGTMSISISEEKQKVSITEQNITLQNNSLEAISRIKWKRHFRIEDDYDLDDIYADIISYDGRTNVHNHFARNLIIALGYKCSISRIGDVYTRMDAVYSNGTTKGAVEIEFGRDTLDASRGILDDIATLQTHNGIDKNDNTALVVCLSYPNKRQGYFQVIKDIKKVLGIEIQTISIGSLLILLWNGESIDLSDKEFYVDFDNLSIRSVLEKILGREVQISDGWLGIIEPEK